MGDSRADKVQVILDHSAPGSKEVFKKLRCQRMGLVKSETISTSKYIIMAIDSSPLNKLGIYYFRLI